MGGPVPQDRDRAGHLSDYPQMLRRYDASAQRPGTRDPTTRIMAGDP
jgi:hypothetical protein